MAFLIPRPARLLKLRQHRNQLRPLMPKIGSRYNTSFMMLGILLFGVFWGFVGWVVRCGNRSHTGDDFSGGEVYRGASDMDDRNAHFIAELKPRGSASSLSPSDDLQFARSPVTRSVPSIYASPGSSGDSWTPLAPKPSTRPSLIAADEPAEPPTIDEDEPDDETMLSAKEKEMLAAMAARDKSSKDKKSAVKAAATQAKTATEAIPSVCKKPAAARENVGVNHVPLLPTEKGVTDYKTGRIHTRWNEGFFRVIKDKTKGILQCDVVWGGEAPTIREWKQALAIIDKYVVDCTRP